LINFPGGIADPAFFMPACRGNPFNQGFHR
jgi:hypothetical protein